MKLIVQNLDGDTFAYFESEKHHKTIEPKRGGLRLDAHKTLPNECSLGAYPNSYFVIDVKKPKKRKKK